MSAPYLVADSVSVAYGRQWKFGPWDFFGTEAEISGAIVYLLSPAAASK